MSQRLADAQSQTESLENKYSKAKRLVREYQSRYVGNAAIFLNYLVCRLNILSFQSSKGKKRRRKRWSIWGGKWRRKIRSTGRRLNGCKSRWGDVCEDLFYESCSFTAFFLLFITDETVIKKRGWSWEKEPLCGVFSHRLAQIHTVSHSFEMVLFKWLEVFVSDWNVPVPDTRRLDSSAHIARAQLAQKSKRHPPSREKRRETYKTQARDVWKMETLVGINLCYSSFLFNPIFFIFWGRRKKSSLSSRTANLCQLTRWSWAIGVICPARLHSQNSALKAPPAPSQPLLFTSVTLLPPHPANPQLPENPKGNFQTSGEGSQYFPKTFLRGRFLQCTIFYSGNLIINHSFFF